jgi:hypothetical protein
MRPPFLQTISNNHDGFTAATFLLHLTLTVSEVLFLEDRRNIVFHFSVVGGGDGENPSPISRSDCMLLEEKTFNTI